MKICLIGKYPPIQGGVSMHNYWIARGLAQKGHKVFVVTNANEVEATFRIQLSEADKEVGGDYAPAFPASSGFVQVHSTEPPDRSEIYYIPMNNPTVTRLATIATDLIRKEGCDAIFSYYLEPYGLAAYLASLWTDVPFVFKHAGSDLYRLACVKELQTAYLEVLYKANLLISAGSSRQQLLAYGVAAERINSEISFGLPTEYFHPGIPPIGMRELLNRSFSADGGDSGSPRSNIQFDESIPALGIYGKLGKYKGSFDLLHAMAGLFRENFKFNLVALSNGWRKPEFQQLAAGLGIDEYVHLLPFQPHWRIPEFIRSATAAAFLERDFPIAAHGPTIPTEVIACGKCLILSEEIARKQKYRRRIRNYKNLIVVSDPKDHGELARAIRFALENPQRADEIGQTGFRELGTDRDAHHNYIKNVESLLSAVANEKCVSRKKVDLADIDSKAKKNLTEVAPHLFPMSFALLSNRQRMKIDGMLADLGDIGNGTSATEQAAIISKAILSVSEGMKPETALLLRERCRYEVLVHSWRGRKSLDLPPTNHPTTNHPTPLLIGQIESFRPSVLGDLQIAEFDCDIEKAALSADSQESLGGGALVTILFHAAITPVRINSSTKELIELILKNSMTVGNIFNSLIERHHIQDEGEQVRLKESCLATLESLYWAGVIMFLA
jgi:glycosyltransferase involved in cell wall biosynthesis